MQLGLTPQLSLPVTPHWALDTVITASAPSLLPLISTLLTAAELLMMIVMTAIVSQSPVWCWMVLIRSRRMLWFCKCVGRRAGTDAEVVGCCQQLFGIFQTPARVAQQQCCPSGCSSSRVWIIWWMGRSFWDVQLSLPTGTQSITLSLSSTDVHPPQIRPTGQGFCQGSSSFLTLIP